MHARSWHLLRQRRPKKAPRGNSFGYEAERAREHMAAFQAAVCGALQAVEVPRAQPAAEPPPLH